MKREKLSEKEIREKIHALGAWSLEDGKLHREIRFEDFVSAFSFMTSVALIAQSMNHHPEWSNRYNTVVIDLSTHDAGGVTEFDLELARRINALPQP